jgi:2-iminobutanoate/2-iminopropanoate deaminase
MRTLTLVAAVVLGGCIERTDPVANAPSAGGRTAITTTGAPPVGPYSPAIQVGNTLWVAGQIGRDPATGQLGATTADQVRLAMDSIGELLEEAGFSFDDIVQAQVFLADLEDYDEMNEVYAGYFTGPAPARAALQVARLPLDARVEILVTAVR